LRRRPTLPADQALLRRRSLGHKEAQAKTSQRILVNPYNPGKKFPSSNTISSPLPTYDYMPE
jgi:hypothetical protein